MEDEGIKNDFLDKKLRWDLLPLEEIEEIVKVYTKGSEKYGDNNWQNLPNGLQRYKAALLRHLVEFEKGNDFDEETNCRHLAQVAWNAIAMLWISKHKIFEAATSDVLLKALNKRIEEKISECNSILDDIENNSLINAAKDIIRPNHIVENPVIDDTMRNFTTNMHDLSAALEIETDNKYKIEFYDTELHILKDKKVIVAIFGYPDELFYDTDHSLFLLCGTELPSDEVFEEFYSNVSRSAEKIIQETNKEE